MIYKLLVMLAILNRGVTAEFKVKCKESTSDANCLGIINCPDSRYTDYCNEYGSSFAGCSCAGKRYECIEGYSFCTNSENNCKCVEEVVVVASTTEKATEPPTTEAPTKMSTEPPTSGAPAKASTKAPTDAPTKAPTTTTTTTTAAPTTTTTTTTASPGLALPWPKYPGRNCYWKNHGAEEVDYPWGKAVANVKTLHACQAACVEAADFGCHGVLFQVATGNCYRKKDIVVEKCVRDESVDLYVRPSATVFVDRLE